MCKLAFMVGIFSSNNASWRRIIGLIIAAAGIFCNPPPHSIFDYFLFLGAVLIVVWQTGEFERWAGRFRRPIVPPVGNTSPTPIQAPTPADPAAPMRQQERAMSTISAALRLIEQILFVFVASLWPNAVGGGDPIPPELREIPPLPPPPREEPPQEAPPPPPVPEDVVERMVYDYEPSSDDDSDSDEREDEREDARERLRREVEGHGRVDVPVQ
jgi:hypothetical protein